MANITPKQEAYLLLFATMEGQDYKLSNAASISNVTKATVIHIVQELTKHGMLQKNEQREIVLTEAGIHYIAPKLEQWMWVSRWMMATLGAPPLTAEKDARTLVCSLSQKTVEDLVELCKVAGNIDHAVAPKNPGKRLGKQYVPFTVYKKDQETISMGDKGFMKPASFEEGEDGCWIVLQADNISYTPRKRNVLKGVLDRLWYKQGKWIEVLPEGDGMYRIPFSATEYHDGDHRATLVIRARATVGMFTMPESEAFVVFDFTKVTIQDKEIRHGQMDSQTD